MRRYITASVQNVGIDGRFRLKNGLCYPWQQVSHPDAPSVIVAECFGKPNILPTNSRLHENAKNEMLKE